jgi:TatA/E family protein of Tat protein translocase
VSVGPIEIVLVLVIALLVFGPNRLPEAGRTFGRTVREFRKAMETARSELGLDEVIDEFKGVKDGLASDFAGSGVNEALSTIKTAATIDLSAAGVAKAATAAVVKPAVDKPVQLAAPADAGGATLPGAALEVPASAADTGIEADASEAPAEATVPAEA